MLLSGGMDSVCALYHVHAANPGVLALSFDYGAKHNRQELPRAEWHCRKLDIEHMVIPLDFMNKALASALLISGGDIPDGHYTDGVMRQTVVPFRNGIMLAIAAGIAESHAIEQIVIAAHSGDHPIYPDCREEFLCAMEQAISTGTYSKPRIYRPFVNMDKAAILRRGMELGVDFARTWSCYKGGELHCGTCGTCVERQEAFQLAGVPDPTSYRDGAA